MRNFQEWHKWTEENGMAVGSSPIPDATPDPQQQQPADGISPPQHTDDEEKMELPTLIEKRLEMLIDELEKKRRLPKPQVVQIMTQIVQSLAEKVNMSNTQMASVARDAGQQAPPPQQQPPQTPQSPSPAPQYPQ